MSNRAERTEIDLNDLNIHELRKWAREYGIKGVTTHRKARLIELIEEHIESVKESFKKHPLKEDAKKTKHTKISHEKDEEIVEIAEKPVEKTIELKKTEEFAEESVDKPIEKAIVPKTAPKTAAAVLSKTIPKNVITQIP
ncbi:MAG: Rho termination factor N-terminal domain-containing protein, partial [Defluviitaleaceae bacterium]|nr:Rho termination factor N-terminal domain-containing protein [Defluviitaleaceae bacterium]